MAVRFEIREVRANDILTAEQVSAMGRIACEWGMLEFALMAHGQNICRVFPGLTFNVLTGNPGGKKIAEILKTVSAVYLPPDVALQFQEIMTCVQHAGIKRDEYVHGVWNTVPAIIGHMTPSQPEDVMLNVTRKSMGRRVQMKAVSTDELDGCAESIAQIRLEMNRLLFPLPYPIGNDIELAFQMRAEGNLDSLAMQYAMESASPRLALLKKTLGISDDT
jgi:hypothetical protein